MLRPAAVLSCAAVLSSPVLAAEPAVTVLRCGRLVDGRSAPRGGVTVVVEGERIKSVGSPAAAPAGSRVIDLSQATCLPGLIDSHTHVLLQGDITSADYDEQLLKESIPYWTIRATMAARRALEQGFTTIRDLETEGAMYADVDVKRAIERGVIPGPRIWRWRWVMLIRAAALHITPPIPAPWPGRRPCAAPAMAASGRTPLSAGQTRVMSTRAHKTLLDTAT